MTRGHRDLFAGDVEWRLSPEGIRSAMVSMSESEPSAPMLFVVEFPAGYRLDPHTHGCDYMEYVVEGSVRVGKIDYGPGDIRLVRKGTGYGPLVFGDDGCKVILVFRDGSNFAPEWLPRQKG